MRTSREPGGIAVHRKPFQPSTRETQTEPDSVQKTGGSSKDTARNHLRECHICVYQMCIWNPLSSLPYIALDEQQLQTCITYKDRSTLLEGLMRPAPLKVIKWEFINTSTQNGGAFTPQGGRGTPQGDPLLAVTRSKGGGGLWEAKASGQWAAGKCLETRLLSFLSGLRPHQSILSSLMDPLKYFILITLERLKKKKKPSNRRTNSFMAEAPPAPSGCWGRSAWPLRLSSHTCHIPCAHGKLSSPSDFITLPRIYETKVTFPWLLHEGSSEVGRQEQTKLACLSHPSSSKPLPGL